MAGKIINAELYAALFEGEELELEFPTEKAANSFRITFSRFKKAQDEAMIAAELLTPAEIKKVVFRKKKNTLSSSSSSYLLRFEDRNPEDRSFLILSASNDEVIKNLEEVISSATPLTPVDLSEEEIASYFEPAS